MIEADKKWKWVRDAWGNWSEGIDDSELSDECLVRFTFATTRFHAVKRVIDRQLADNILNREMTPEVEEFLQSDEGQQIAEWFQEFNKPSWLKHEGEPAKVECVQILVRDLMEHEGGE